MECVHRQRERHIRTGARPESFAPKIMIPTVRNSQVKSLGRRREVRVPEGIG